MDIECLATCNLMLPRRLFEEVGGFDNLFFFYIEDLGLTWRVHQKGYWLIDPDAWRRPESVRDDTRRAEVRYRRRRVWSAVARMATPRDIKDRIAKRLFRHPRLVRDMLGAFVPTEWTAAVDLDSLRELPVEFINPRGDKRLGDLLLLGGAPGAVPTLVMVEHQSAPVPRLAARMMTRTGMLYESLTPRAQDTAGRPPTLRSSPVLRAMAMPAPAR